MSGSSSLYGRLADLLGPDSLGPADPEQMAKLGAERALLAIPGTPELLAAALKLCADLGAAAVAVGSGTKLDRGRNPGRVDVLFSTAALNGINDYQSEDLTVSAQAGIRLAQLQSELAGRGQFLALDPPWPQDATLGGLLATASEGPLRRRYGALRDQLLGIRVAGPDGQLSSAGGRVVKNVSGYDLTRLHTGAFGTLGVITDVNLKVWPLPEAESTLAAAVADPWPALTALSQAEFWPMAADLFLGSATADIFPDRTDSGAVIALRFGGRRETNARGLRDALKIFQDCRAIELTSWESEQSMAFWRRTSRLQPGSQRAGAAVAAIALPARQRFEVLLAAAKRLRDRGLDFGAWGRTEHGLAWLAIGNAEAESEAAGNELSWLREQVGAHRGNCRFEHLPGSLAEQLDPWGPADPVAWAAMLRLKEAMDPLKVLSPGRYLGGI